MGCVLLLQEHSVEKRPWRSYWKGDKSREGPVQSVPCTDTHITV